MSADIREITEKVQKESVFVAELRRELGAVIVGQEEMLERLLVALLGKGHVLLEGVPGLAKTLTINTLAQCVDAKFQRIQFTPDLLPADLTGTLVFNPKEGTYAVRRGPVFANLILADEINRAPAKVQSALLEAMQERQVTIGDETHRLPELFMVLATQNPIEQEGTYPLPEAQVDRFMLKLVVTYPKKEEERLILERMTDAKPPQPRKVTDPEQIL
ncbi:ATPase, partial [bacterium]